MVLAADPRVEVHDGLSILQRLCSDGQLSVIPRAQLESYERHLARLEDKFNHLESETNQRMSKTENDMQCLKQEMKRGLADLRKSLNAAIEEVSQQREEILQQREVNGKLNKYAMMKDAGFTITCSVAIAIFFKFNSGN